MVRNDARRIWAAGVRAAGLSAATLLLGASANAQEPGATGATGATDAPGTVLQDCPRCPPVVVIPAGALESDAPEEEIGHGGAESASHLIELDAFALGQTEVTLSEYRHFIETSGYAPGGDGCATYEDGLWRVRAARDWADPGYAQSEAHPVVCVSWRDAVAYAAWLSAETGEVYRLPSDAEWEYAARAGGAEAYPWGAVQSEACAHGNIADLSAVAEAPLWATVDCDDGAVAASAAASYAPNAFGLYDMIGNTFEWTAACWRPSSLETEASCAEAVLRGGSFMAPPDYLRTAARAYLDRSERYVDTGFRLVRELPPPEEAPEIVDAAPPEQTPSAGFEKSKTR